MKPWASKSRHIYDAEAMGLKLYGTTELPDVKRTAYIQQKCRVT